VLILSTAAVAGDPLPYYDARLQPDGKPAAFVPQAKAAAVSTRQADARKTAENVLRQDIPGLHTDEHEFFATPHYVGSTEKFLTAPAAAAAPRQIARQFVASNADLFRVDPVEIDNARIERDFVSDHNGVTHLTFQQQINGIDLFGCEVLANVTARGVLINISSTMLPRPAGDFAPPAPILSPLDAIRAAAASIGIKMTADPTPLAAPEGVNHKQTWKNTPDFRGDEPITTDLIYFPSHNPTSARLGRSSSQRSELAIPMK
jgi:Zn-dependent metalloprotease